MIRANIKNIISSNNTYFF